MNFLFADTETAGLPKDYKAPMTALDNWPKIIQIAWLLSDDKGEVINEKQYLIYPDNFEIPKEPFWIDHGFSTEKSKAEGIPLRRALHEFILDLNQCDFLVCHNMNFDKNVIGCEMVRYEMRGKRVEKICTMESSIDFCKIPFTGQRNWYGKVTKTFKWPSLKELHFKLFGKDFEAAHSASGDVAALKNCFFELVKIGVISLQTPAN